MGRKKKVQEKKKVIYKPKEEVAVTEDKITCDTCGRTVTTSQMRYCPHCNKSQCIYCRQPYGNWYNTCIFCTYTFKA